jgi:hypothetical protein
VRGDNLDNSRKMREECNRTLDAAARKTPASAGKRNNQYAKENHRDTPQMRERRLFVSKATIA